jgi:phage terminase small subunit
MARKRKCLMPEPPAWVTASPLSLAKYRELWAAVDPEMVTALYQDWIVIYCGAWASYCAANDSIIKHGELDADGKVRTDVLRLRDKALRTMQELACDLGIAPGAPRIVWSPAPGSR